MGMKYVLGIETSCDETSAAVVGYKVGEGGVVAEIKILSNIISSQIDIHAQFGGVVPEIASRNHVQAIDFVVKEALKCANSAKKAEICQTCVRLGELSCVAATTHPGLPGAVLIGRTFGASLATALGIPFVGVNHILGHIASVPLSNQELLPGQGLVPHIALVVSGGHTALYRVSKTGRVKWLETALDDAIGEAFDKVARVLGLSYPGGPAIQAKAIEYRVRVPGSNENLIKFVNQPNYARDGFSYSGLKTAVINCVNRLKQRGEILDVPRLCASFEREAVAQVVYKTLAALKKTRIKTLTVSGGVSANAHMRDILVQKCQEIGVKVHFPSIDLTGDNAAMIAAAAILGLKLVD